MNDSEFLADQLSRAKAFHDFVAPIFDTGSIEEGSFFYLLYFGVSENVLEHYIAILKLLEDGDHFVSACALLRPLMDTTLQSVWLLWCGRKAGYEAWQFRSLVLPSGAECAGAIKEFMGAKYPGPFTLLATEPSALSGNIHPEVEIQQRRFNGRVMWGPNWQRDALTLFIQQASESVAIAAIVLMNKFGGHDPNIAGPEAERVARKYVELFGTVT